MGDKKMCIIIWWRSYVRVVAQMDLVFVFGFTALFFVLGVTLHTNSQDYFSKLSEQLEDLRQVDNLNAPCSLRQRHIKSFSVTGISFQQLAFLPWKRLRDSRFTSHYRKPSDHTCKLMECWTHNWNLYPESSQDMPFLSWPPYFAGLRNCTYTDALEVLVEKS